MENKILCLISLNLIQVDILDEVSFYDDTISLWVKKRYRQHESDADEIADFASFPDET